MDLRIFARADPEIIVGRDGFRRLSQFWGLVIFGE
jgi:hypothetical protein